MARRLTAHFEDGHVQERRTDRLYTHCWRVFIPAGTSDGPLPIRDMDGNPISWEDHYIHGWSHSEQQATKTAQRRCMDGVGRRFQIAAATVASR